MTQDATKALSERLAFIGLDGHAKTMLNDMHEDVLASVPPALDAFYESVRKVPNLMSFFSNEAHLEMAKKRQNHHWGVLASGAFDSNYVEGVTTIGKAHARIGLEPRWYIGGYAVLLDNLIAQVMERRWPSRFGKPKGRKLAKEIGTLVKAALLDMDYSISVYLDILAEQRRSAEADRILLEAHQTQALAELSTVLQTLSRGDLETRMTQDLPENFLEMAENYNDSVEKLRSSISAVRKTSEEILKATREIAAATDDLAERTEQQAAGVEQSSAALHELTESVTSTARGAEQSASVVAETLTVAQSSGAVVTEAVAAMSEISNSSNEISKIIGVIDEIAFQTNLLALNAGVEAARAGDAGRGFAVVAQEVRELAQRSAAAAREIKGIISQSASQVERGVQLVNKSGNSLNDIIAKVKDLHKIISGIAQAASEQSGGLREVNEAIASMDTITQRNAVMVEKTSNETRNLGDQVEMLTKALQGFRSRDPNSERVKREQAEKARQTGSGAGQGAAYRQKVA